MCSFSVSLFALFLILARRHFVVSWKLSPDMVKSFGALIVKTWQESQVEQDDVFDDPMGQWTKIEEARYRMTEMPVFFKQPGIYQIKVTFLKTVRVTRRSMERDIEGSYSRLGVTISKQEACQHTVKA